MLFVVVVSSSVVISNVKEAVVRAYTKATDEYFLNARRGKKNCRDKKKVVFFRKKKTYPKDRSSI